MKDDSVCSTPLTLQAADHERPRHRPVEGLGHADGRLHGEGFGVAFPCILFRGAAVLLELLPLGLRPAVLLLMLLLLLLHLPVHPVHWGGGGGIHFFYNRRKKLRFTVMECDTFQF